MVSVNRGFGREKRLLSPQHFKRVFDSPVERVSGGQILLLIHPNGLNHPRLGLVVSKKNVRLSVERNRIKRQLRESFRCHQTQLGSWDIVAIARKGIADKENAQLAKLFSKLWRRISSIDPAGHPSSHENT